VLILIVEQRWIAREGHVSTVLSRRREVMSVILLANLRGDTVAGTRGGLFIDLGIYGNRLILLKFIMNLNRKSWLQLCSYNVARLSKFHCVLTVLEKGITFTVDGRDLILPRVVHNS
jgi:hypothetical protein